MNSHKRILIVDSDISEAYLISIYLSKQNCTVLNVVSKFKDVVKSINNFIPDIIVISIQSDNENIPMLKISLHVHQIYGIPVIMLITHFDQIILDTIIATDPYTCLLKTKDKFVEQIYTAIQFCKCPVCSNMEKYNAIEVKSMQLDIAGNGEPVSSKNMKHNFTDNQIIIADIQCISAGNGHFKNGILFKLYSDDLHFLVVRDTLLHWLQLLPSAFYSRVHEAHIVNNNILRNKKFSDIIMVDKYKIHISRRYYKTIYKLYRLLMGK